ncbi:MAG: PD-(D/E)XK nuclease family protein [Euryarchaeota archaeon]|nr:PD-(D/E)XK nuclease family protein [Euryarchaeota archaeon]
MPDLDAPRSDTGTARHGKTRWRTVVARHDRPLEAEAERLRSAHPEEETLIVVRTAPQRARLLRTLAPPVQVLTLSELFALAGAEEVRDEDLIPDALLDRIVTKSLPARFQGAHRDHMAFEVRKALHILSTHGLTPSDLGDDARGDLFDALHAAHDALGDVHPRLHTAGLHGADERVLLSATGPCRLRQRFPTVRRLVVSGVDSLSPMERAALTNIAEPVEELHLLVVGSPPDDPERSAGTLFTAPLIRWAQARGPVEDLGATGPRAATLERLFSATPAPPVPLPGVHIAPRPYDRGREIETAVLRVVDLIGSGTRPDKIAIVVPRLGEYSGLLAERLTEHGVPYAISHPGPTRSTPSGVFMRLLLEALRKGLPRDAVLDLVDHPLTHFPALGPEASDGHLRANLLRRWLLEQGLDPHGRKAWADALARLDTPIDIDRADDGRPTPRWDPWQEAQRAGLTDLLDRLEVLRTAPDAAHFFDRFRETIDHARLGESVARAARDVPDAARMLTGHARALELIDETEDALHLAPDAPVTAADARDALLRALWRDPLPPQGDPGWGVQVLGLRNARGLFFDHVLVLGAEQGALPGPARDRALHARLAGALGRRLERIDPDLEARRIVHGLLADTEGSVVFSVRRHEGDADVTPSVLLDELEDAFLLDPAPAVPDTVRSLRALHRQAGLTGRALPETTAVDVTKKGLVTVRSTGRDGTPWTGRIADPALAGAVGLVPEEAAVSASRIETYARCPAHHFFRYVLGLTTPRERDGRLDPLDKGHLVHGILHDMAQDGMKRRGVPYRAAADPDAEARLLAVAIDRLDAVPWSNVHWDAFRIALLGGLRGADNPYSGHAPGLLARWLEDERKGGAGIIATEEKFGPDTTPVIIETPQGPVPLGGKIDRIDLVSGDEGEVLRVVDYKTGNIPNRRLTQEGVHFQLPLYLIAARAIHPDHSPGEATYHQLAKPTRKDTRIERAHLPGPDGDLEVFLDETTPGRVADMVTAARAGHVPLTLLSEDEAGCGHCDHRRVCGLRPHLVRGRRRDRLDKQDSTAETDGHLPDRARSL